MYYQVFNKQFSVPLILLFPLKEKLTNHFVQHLNKLFVTFSTFYKIFFKLKFQVFQTYFELK